MAYVPPGDEGGLFLLNPSTGILHFWKVCYDTLLLQKALLGSVSTNQKNSVEKFHLWGKKKGENRKQCSGFVSR